tara:strand:+ start:968 stop:1201 length:234 start_codon:yes stop_codon:yes gene_type:complete
MFSRSEYTKILDACSESHLTILRDIVMFADSAGVRQGEILRLKRDHINYEKMVFLILVEKYKLFMNLQKKISEKKIR